MCCLFLLSTCLSALGQNLENPTAFFTNLASGLLQSDLKVSLTHIPIYPTNQYTPAVHRLLQVTANIYGSTTNSPYPVIYRPYFSQDGTNIFISGYEEVDPLDGSLLGQPLDLTDPSDRALIGIDTRTNIYGIPWIFSAKKGLPNFNELSVDSFFQITRQLRVVRASPDLFIAPIGSYQVQQKYLLGISNVFGVELWNSYRTNFTTPVEIIVAGDLTYSLTNSDGVQINNRIVYGPSSTNVSQWPGRGPATLPASESFVIPTRTNFILLPPAAYRHSPPGWFAPADSAGFEPVFSNAVAWGLCATNHVRVLIREAATGRVLDYVQFGGPGSYRNLSEEIRTPNSTRFYSGLWSTNLTVKGLPWGIQQQFDISWGNDGLFSGADWSSYGFNQPTGPAREFAVDNFRAFYHLSPIYGNIINNTNLIQLTPFTPTRVAQMSVSWQANDPLVHYTPEDLTDITLIGIVSYLLPNGVYTNLANIGVLNFRFNPWGGNPFGSGSGLGSAYTVALKDPLIRSPDDWNFPNGSPLSVATLAQIHRGTPWQTIYLKTDDITANAANQRTWRNWLGVTNNAIALQMAPKRDWRLASRIARRINTNDVHKLFSPNDTDPTHWLSLFKPMIALTNILSDSQVNISPPIPPQFDQIRIGLTPASLFTVIDAIQSTRAGQPTKMFRDPGDILGTTNLSTISPWLNITTTAQRNLGITDEAFEKIPVQLLPLLRLDSIATIETSANGWLVSFTGYDGYSYAVETSSNLLTWSTAGTYQPTNGTFSFTISASSAAGARFYRSVLQ